MSQPEPQRPVQRDPRTGDPHDPDVEKIRRLIGGHPL